MFTAIPSQFESLKKPLIYRYETTTKQPLVFTIYDAQMEQILCVKKFNPATSFELNVAPIVRPFAIPHIEPESIGFVDQTRQGVIEVLVVASEESTGEVVDSESRWFTLSDRRESGARFISSISEDRCLSQGESEWLRFNIEDGASLYVTVDQYVYGWNSHSGLSNEERALLMSEPVEVPLVTRSYLLDSSYIPIVGFCVSAIPFEEQLDYVDELDLEKVVVCVTQIEEGDADDEPIETELANVTYHIFDAPQKPVRLAWVSQRGSVEHYTFPKIAEVKRGDGVTAMSIVSALEPIGMREVLQEIVCSPRLWMVEADGYREVSLVNRDIVVDFMSELEALKIEICYYD